MSPARQTRTAEIVKNYIFWPHILERVEKYIYIK